MHDGFEEPPGLRWDEVDLREHLPSVGFSHLVTWQHAVSSQAERLASSAGTSIEVQADVFLFVHALRQVLRAAELVAEGLVDDPRRETVERAIGEFNRDVPHAKDVRDVLDHFDDYARGVGRLSHPDARNSRDRVRGASAQAAREYRFVLQRGEAGTCVLQLGAVSVETMSAEAAASRLTSTVLGVWWEPVDDHELAAFFAGIGPDSPMFPVVRFMQILDGKYPWDLIELTVTPESLPLWSLEGLREATSGYGLASGITYAADDVAYVKLVKGPSYAAVVREATLVEAQVLTIQRRSDLDGEWRIHQLGEPARTTELPSARFRKLRVTARNLFRRPLGNPRKHVDELPETDEGAT